MEKFHAFKHKGLDVIEVPLTEEEIRECLELGNIRTEINEKVKGWIYRHPGMKSELAHAVGFMGELCFEKWLKLEGLIKDKDYVRGKSFVESLQEIEQDFTIGGKEVGVKSAPNESLDEATKYGTFLYPAKILPGEARRVLGYPDFLVQTVVSIGEKKCWLCGFADKETVVRSPTREIYDKPAHRIPIEKYRPVKELLRILRAH